MKEHKKGFTIIEITLAMTFLAILMVSIATLIMRVTNIYQKGLAMRAINATGTEIIEVKTDDRLMEKRYPCDRLPDHVFHRQKIP